MSVRGRVERAGRVWIALALVLVGLVFVGAAPVSAAIPPGFAVQPPERLYMMPANPLAPIPTAIVDLAVPVTSMKFTSTPFGDLISGDDREIVVDFVDTPTTPDPPGPCDIVDVPGAVGGNLDYPIGNCTRIQMNVTHGTLQVGALTKVYQDLVNGAPSSAPVDAVYLTASGARVDISDTAVFDAGQDYTNNNGVLNLNLWGTKQQLNDALKQLEYTPDPDEDNDGDPNEHDFYHYDGTNAETLAITLVPDDGSGPFDWDVDIRVLDVNDWPELDGANELGDTAGDGPLDQMADPGLEKIIPGTYSLTDVDNDDLIDTYGPDGMPGGGDDIVDPDGNDGPGSDMLLIGYLSCGKPILPGTGFHFDSASFSSAGDTIESALNYALGIPTTPPMVPPAMQGELDEYNNLVFARDAFMTGLMATPLADATLQSAGSFTYGNYFVGIGGINDIQDALKNIYFEHNQENDTCDMLVIVSDLGNNGLPVKYLSDPDARQYGVEVPFFGFDWDEFAITTGAFQEIDASFDPATPLPVGEGQTATATIAITPATHPAFDLHFSAVSGVGPGGAIGNTDFAQLTDLTVSVPQDAASVTVDTNVYNDNAVEGTEHFTFEITVPTDPPPPFGGFTVPVGYSIVSAAPTRTVLILDDDDPPRTITSVSNPTVTEGDTGTTNLSFVIGLDGEADGNETVDVTTSGATPGTDYVALSQTVTFAPGDTTATVNVVVQGDYAVEPDEQVTLTLSNPVNTSIDPAALSGVGTIQNDDSLPTVTVDQAAGQADPTKTFPIVFDVVFDRDVTGFTDGLTDVVLGGTVGGTLLPMITMVDPSHYTVSVFGMTTSGTMTADVVAGAAQDVGLRDNVASTSTDNTVTWDVDGPDVTINQGAAQVDPTTVSPILFDVVFSEPVTNFVTGDVTLSGTAGATAALVTGSGTTYTVSVSGMSVDGTVIADIAANKATDALGNGNTPATFTDHTVTFDFDEGDITAPTVTIDQAAGQSDPTMVSPVMFTAVFDEPVFGFDSPSDLDLTASTTDGVLTPTITNSGDNQTFTVSVAVVGATMDGDVIATVKPMAAKDASNNDSVASTSLDNVVVFDVDTDPPTVTIDQAVSQVDPTTASPVHFTAIFSEPVTGFDATDVALTNGTGGTLTPSVTTGDNITFDVSVAVVSPTMTGLITASIGPNAAMDAASNQSAASTSNDNEVTFELDTTPPTVSIEQAGGQGDPTMVSPVLFTVTFSEPIVGFDSTDIALTNGTGGALAPTVTPTADPLVFDVTVAVAGATMTGAIVASVPASAVTDAQLNPSAASTSTDNTVTFEVQAQNNPDPLAIQVPGNIVRDADPNQNGAVVTYAPPTTTGGTPPVMIVCDHLSGAFYPLGTTTVTCTATDSAQPDQPVLPNFRDDAVSVMAALTVAGSFTITVNQVTTVPNNPTTTVAGPSPTTIPGSTNQGGTVPGATTPPVNTFGAIPPTGQLPETGSDVKDLLALAAAAVVIGGVLLLVRRRPATG